MEAKRRRLETNLYISGLAFIFLGLWALVKVCVNIVMELIEEIAAVRAGLAEEDVDVAEIIDTLGREEFEKWVAENIMIQILGLVVFSLIVILFHLLIGRAAMLDARGKRKNCFYLGFIFLYLFIDIASYVVSIGKPDAFDWTDLLSILIESTTVFCLAVIFVSAVQLRKIRKQANADPPKEGGAVAGEGPLSQRLRR